MREAGRVMKTGAAMKALMSRMLTKRKRAAVLEQCRLKMRIKINLVTGNELLCVYPGQQKPQDTYLWLDIVTEQMGAAYNPEIGNTVPMEVWHGVVRRYPIPLMTGSEANLLLEELVPLAERVVAGAWVKWDGCNKVGLLYASALAAEEEIERVIATWDGQLYWGG